jgi:hypothetical protein
MQTPRLDADESCDTGIRMNTFILLIKSPASLEAWQGLSLINHQYFLAEHIRHLDGDRRALFRFYGYFPSTRSYFRSGTSASVMLKTSPS